MTKQFRTVFFGTPEYAVPSLKTLVELTDVALVVTQPDKPSGRGQKSSSPPVKEVALGLGLDVIQPDVVKGRRFAEEIAALAPDFLVTAAYGKIFGRSLLAVPRLACLNLHASLLPKFRGAAPANWAIMNGDDTTGVSVMQMSEGLDEGPVYHSRAIPIGPEETTGELLLRLAEVGAVALRETLLQFSSLTPKSQEPSDVSWAPSLEKKDGHMDWSLGARLIHRKVRGLHPWPLVSTPFGQTSLIVHRATLVASTGIHGLPGEIIALGDGVDVACGEGVIRLLEVQVAGRKRMGAKDFLVGARLKRGDRLG